ncbi:Smr/MutS family protein [Geobacter sp.]|uniref:Smr/MutS family protein n=1 Tax=Geobacter sp. TaxID=46610 RepID=UPI00261BA44D|nr:Smr/MutS family protein [Geobacter sp.]
MKKKTDKTEKPGKKGEDFRSTPFSTLKRFRAEPPRREEPKKEPAPPPAAPEPDDAALFLRAVSDAKPLAPRASAAAPKKETPRPAPAPAVDEGERQEFLAALKKLKLDVSFREGIPAARGAMRPIPVNRLRELKKGTIRIVRELDLHGLTRDEALQALERFVASAHRHGEKAVVIITGKGNNSPGEPVLQGAVVGWLREKGKGMVAEFAPAPRDLGGSGALVVFLRRPAQKEG